MYVPIMRSRTKDASSIRSPNVQLTIANIENPGLAWNALTFLAFAGYYIRHSDMTWVHPLVHVTINTVVGFGCQVFFFHKSYGCGRLCIAIIVLSGWQKNHEEQFERVAAVMVDLTAAIEEPRRGSDLSHIVKSEDWLYIATFKRTFLSAQSYPHLPAKQAKHIDATRTVLVLAPPWTRSTSFVHRQSQREKRDQNIHTMSYSVLRRITEVHNK